MQGRAEGSGSGGGRGVVSRADRKGRREEGGQGGMREEG